MNDLLLSLQLSRETKDWRGTEHAYLFGTQATDG